MSSSTFDARVRRALQGKYQVEERLGQGGTATVYRAQPARGNRIVAVKSRPATGDEAAQRFRREIEIHRTLDHPHIAAFIDAGRASVGDTGAANRGAVRYLAMEHLDGGDLAGLLQNQSLSVENACSLLQPVVEALHHVHEQNIVHRDVNPSNILLSEDGQAHLIDFSIALGPGHTPLGDGTLCTPAYMSPEQHGGEGPDSRTDIFSFGIVLYEALTGQKPFGTWMHREQEITPPRELDPAVPAELVDVVMRCLERDPDRRIQTARVLADALAPFTDRSKSTNVNSTSQSSRSQSTQAEADPNMGRSSARARNVDTTTAIGFLESRPDFARRLISRWAEIPVRLLRAHPDFWDWDALSRNENLSWSASLLDEYARKWDWAALSANEAIPFDGDLIERHQRKWDWELLSVNEALPWSADLIRRFSDRWPWGISSGGLEGTFSMKGALSMNRALPWSAELLDAFEHRWDWRILSGNSTLPWTVDLLDRYRHRWTWGVAPKQKDLCYQTLSTNSGLPWTEGLVSSISGVWDWTELSRNPALSWSEAFLEQYRERWNWRALSVNAGLPWSQDLLDRYDDKWSWRGIATNEGLPWDGPLFDHVWNQLDGVSKGMSLGGNRSVPWSKGLTKRLTQRCWCVTRALRRAPLSFLSQGLINQFERLQRKNNGKKRLIGQAIPRSIGCWEMNPALRWSPVLLQGIGLHSKRGPGWAGIATNRGVPWSAALLSEFNERFFPDHQSVLIENDQVWHRAFAPAVTESVLRRLVREA